MLTTRRDEFVSAVKSHPDFERFQLELDQQNDEPDEQVTRVQYERFLRVADNVVLKENLRRMKNADKIKQYEGIVAAERLRLFTQP